MTQVDQAHQIFIIIFTLICLSLSYIKPKYNKMITFYEWNKTFKTLSSSFTPILQQPTELVLHKNDDLLINGYKRKSRKSCKQKTVIKHFKRQQKPRKQPQNQQVIPAEFAPFKNLAIRQRFKTVSPQKNDESIQSPLIISKIDVRQCQMSIQKILSKRLAQTFISSERQKQDNQKKTARQISSKYHGSISQKKQSLSRAKMLDETNFTTRKSLAYHSKTAYKMKSVPSVADTQKPCNLILNTQSILSQFLKQQTHQKSIKTNKLANRKSSKGSKTENNQEEPAFLLPARGKKHMFDQNRLLKRYRKSASNYKHQIESI